jgi:hypothetical protein
MNADRDRPRLALLRAFVALGAPLAPREPLTLPDAPRMLLIRPDHIGDLLFTTPAVRALRQAFPPTHLVGVVGSWRCGATPGARVWTAVHSLQQA